MVWPSVSALHLTSDEHTKSEGVRHSTVDPEVGELCAAQLRYDADPSQIAADFDQ